MTMHIDKTNSMTKSGVGRRTTKRWTDWDYLVATAYTLALIAPCPFFWNPPFWILTFLSVPPRGSARRIDRTARTAPIVAGRPEDEPEAANDNTRQQDTAAEAA